MSEQKELPFSLKISNETDIEIQKTKQCIKDLNNQIKNIANLGIKVNLSFDDIVEFNIIGVKAKMYVII